ncbi:MAG: hypothetical protein P4L27_03855 [Ignavibacteriaceae bacterium]|nr:hypothetical protein [Ignavibacteriaceae bacterium]
MLKLNLYLLGYIYFLAVIFQGCVSLPSDLIMPQWDTDLNVPITTKNYTLDDIVKSQNYISINPSDNTYLISSDSLNQEIPISNFIQINTETSTPTAPVPADNKTTVSAYLPFPEGAKLSQAVITQGKFKVVAHNTFSIDAQLTLNFPGVTRNGASIPVTFTVPAYSNSTIQLVGFANTQYIQPANQDTSKNGQLWITASATSSTGLIYITFESYTSDFNFSSAVGYLPKKSLGTHSNSFPLNLGDASKYRDKVVLQNGSLSLTGKYKSISANPFLVGVNNLRLVGKRNDSHLTDTLKFIDATSNSFTFDASGNYSTVYNEHNSNITSFITFLPDSIFVSAEYIMNYDNSTAYKTVRMDDSISFTTRFTSQSILSIAQTTFTDTVNIDIDHDKRDQIQNGKGAQLNVDFQNAIPLNSWVKVTLTDINYHPLLINGSKFIITKNSNGTDSVNIPGSQTDVNGIFVNTSSAKTSITLDSLQIRQFSQNAYHAIISVTVETSHQSVPVVVHATDWIKLNIYGRVTYTVKNNN